MMFGIKELIPINDDCNISLSLLIKHRPQLIKCYVSDFDDIGDVSMTREELINFNEVDVINNMKQATDDSFEFVYSHVLHYNKNNIYISMAENIVGECVMTSTGFIFKGDNYDKLINVISGTEFNKHSTVFTHDDDGSISSFDDSGMLVHTYIHNEEGNLSEYIYKPDDDNHDIKIVDNKVYISSDVMKTEYHTLDGDIKFIITEANWGSKIHKFVYQDELLKYIVTINDNGATRINKFCY